MLYRTFAVVVVCFWLTMIVLLVQKEIGSAGSALREVPVGHVIKLILTHEQKSELYILSEKLRVGSLSILPQMRKDRRSRVIEFSGHLQLMIPGAERQNVRWDGEVELEKTLATRRFEISVAFSDPAVRTGAGYRAQIAVDPGANLLTYSLFSGDLLLDRQHTYTLDETGLKTALAEMQLLDPATVEMLHGQAKTFRPPVIKALQSSMLIHGESIDTYLVSIEQSGQTLLEFDVDQLGHILRAKTFIGYSLAVEDIVP